MRKSAKLITALSIAGLAVVAGTAFTGSGLTNSAGSTQFVGGEVTQGITGATLNDVNYTFSDTTNRAVESVELSFPADSVGKHVGVVFAAASGGTYTCTDVVAITFTSNCTADAALATDVTSAAITVS